jgi:3-dehydroquinate dehydratase-2
MKLLVINGPNLNLLGIREPAIYGQQNFQALEDFIRSSAEELGHTVTLFQSNHEGAIVDKIQEAYGVYDGIVINPAAYTHTSVAILDALKAVGIPTVEVHLSDINAREEFRRHSYVSMVAAKTVCGLGFEGYREALAYFAKQA